ncbi:MAG: alpha-ribazole phosphatase [Chlorobiales bacterium]
MNLFLIRHTEVESAQGWCIGQSDVALSEKGKREIGVLVEQLKPIAPSRLISSDLARCRALAEKLSEVWSLTVQVKRAWREVDFGQWEGKTWDEIYANDQSRYDAWAKDFLTIAPPEGESFLKLHTRIKAELNALEKLQSETVMVITHAGAIRAAISSAIGLPLERVFSIHLNYGARVHLSLNKGFWTLQNLNNTLLPCH